MAELTREQILALNEHQLREEAAKLLGWKKLPLPEKWYSKLIADIFDIKNPGFWIDNEKKVQGSPSPANWETIGKIVGVIKQMDIIIQARFVYELDKMDGQLKPCRITDITFEKVVRVALLAKLGV